MRRGPAWFLLWLVRRQWPRVLAGSLLGSTSMLTLVFAPAAIGAAVDALRRGDRPALIGWSAVVLALGSVGAVLGMLRHRTMTRIRMDAAYRTIDVVLGRAVALGAALPNRITAGEVVTIGVGDAWVVARGLTVTGPGFGGLVGYAGVALLLVRISPPLAAVVLAGVPALVLLVGPLLGRLQRAGSRYRESSGHLAEQLLDIVGGLRLLNGLGGKREHEERYQAGSRELVAEGYRVGAVSSWVEALGAGLPALFLALVIWVAAHLAARGDITVGELASVYGYAAILAVPVAIFIMCGKDVSKALVAARRVTDLLAVVPEPVTGAESPSGPVRLHDPESGVTVEPGQLTVLAGPGAAGVVDRLGRYGPTTAEWNGVPLEEIAKDRVRERILVADNEAHLFPGPLSEVVAGRAELDEPAVRAALHTAVARDISGRVEPDGRNLSGGQRQRVRLARALYQQPELLLAVEPTSAVDAHTETAIAERIAVARAGRGTVIATTSPVLLGRADVVHFLHDGRVKASGTHRELLEREPSYRELVSRG